jgi:hypothetical protein
MGNFDPKAFVEGQYDGGAVVQPQAPAPQPDQPKPQGFDANAFAGTQPPRDAAAAPANPHRLSLEQWQAMPFYQQMVNEIPGRTEEQDTETGTPGRALNYGAGVLGTAAVQGIRGGQALMGGEFRDSSKDMMEALKGYAKPIPQQLKESGFGKLIQYGLGIPLALRTDPFIGAMSMRNPSVISKPPGFFEPADVGNWKLKGYKEQEIPNIIRRATNRAGDETEKALYNNAFKDVDRAAADRKAFQSGTEDQRFSDELQKSEILEPGMSGRDIERRVLQERKNVGGELNEIRGRNNDLQINPGGVVGNATYTQRALNLWGKYFSRVAQSPKNLAEAIEKRFPGTDKGFVEWIAEKYRIPENRDELNDLLDRIAAHEREFGQGADPDTLNRLAARQSKEATGKVGSNSDSGKVYAREGVFKEGLSRYAQSLRNLGTKAVSEVDPLAAEALPNLNRRYSILEGAGKPLRMLTKKLDGVKAFSVVDGILAGGAGMASAFHSPQTAGTVLGGLALKKLVQYGNTPAGAVRLGSMARSVGNSSIWDRALRQYMQGQYDQGDEQ